MKRPIIGITTSVDSKENAVLSEYTLRAFYANALLDGQGVPLLLVPSTDPCVLESYISCCDALLLTGGCDIDPALYGEEKKLYCGATSPMRDEFEQLLFKTFLPTKKPILGICRGAQLINIAMGGTLYQDIATEYPSSILHRQPAPCEEGCHTVLITEHTPLFEICRAEEIFVNSYHHQAIKRLGMGLLPMAWAEDGLTEAVYAPSHPFLIGVQWHPERLYRREESAKALFHIFVAACR